MKVLIPTMGTRGDIQPYIALARGMDKSGFETIIATHPCWQHLIEGYGVNFVAVGPDIDIEFESAAIRAASKNWVLGTIRTMKFVFKIIEQSSEEIKNLCQNSDLVIASHSHIGAAEAEATGIPFISVTLQPSYIPGKLEPRSPLKILFERFTGFLINPFMVGPYNKLRKKLGLKTLKTFDELLSPYLNLIPVSSAVYPPDKYWEDKNKVVGYWFVEEVDNYEPPKDLLDFLNKGEPPVIISLGAMAFESQKEREKLDIIVNSIKRTGMRAVLQGFNETLKDYSLPDNIISVGSIPHSWLFRQASFVIHHGGFGTTAAVFKEGKPAIVIPHIIDQYLWANRVYELKAGPRPIKSKDLNGKRLTDSIRTLKEKYDYYLENTQKIGEKISLENGLEKTIHLIKEIVEDKVLKL